MIRYFAIAACSLITACSSTHIAPNSAPEQQNTISLMSLQSCQASHQCQVYSEQSDCTQGAKYLAVNKSDSEAIHQQHLELLDVTCRVQAPSVALCLQEKCTLVD